MDDLAEIGLPKDNEQRPSQRSEREKYESRNSLRPALDKEITGSASSLQSDVENKLPVTHLNYSIYEKNQSFSTLFCNAIIFYHRLFAVFFSHNPKVGRAYKALNLAT